MVRIARKYIRSQIDDPECTDPSVVRHRARLEWEREYDKIQAEDTRHRNEGKANRQWFVTFNPPESVHPSDLWSIVSKYLAKNFGRSIEAYHLVLEQRSEDADQPTGWHVHFLVRYDADVTRSRAIQKMKSVVDKLWDEAQQKHPQFTRAWCVWKPLQAYHEAYVSGGKKAEKQAKVQADRVIRARLGFPEFLSQGQIIFPAPVIEDGVLSEEGKEDGGVC